MLGGADRYDFGKCMAVREFGQKRQQPLARMHLVDFVDGREHRTPAAHEVLQHQIILAGPLQRLNHEYAHIGIGQYRGSRPVHRPIEGPLGALMNARCVNEGDLGRGHPRAGLIPDAGWSAAAGVTMLSFWPISAFSNVDLPTFGLPTSAAKPQRKSSLTVMVPSFRGPHGRQYREFHAKPPPRPPARRAAGSGPGPWLPGPTCSLRSVPRRSGHGSPPRCARPRRPAAAPPRLQVLLQTGLRILQRVRRWHMRHACGEQREITRCASARPASRYTAPNRASRASARMDSRRKATGLKLTGS